MSSDPMKDHYDAVPDRSRFGQVRFQGQDWDLSHLDPFALAVEIDPGLFVTVVVFFSCHCFTHGEGRDGRILIPPSEYYRDAWEQRVLCPERYRLSRLFLPRLVQELPARTIRVPADRDNFFVLEATDSEGVAVQYAAFFSLERDARRRKRMLLRVQSAFPIEQLGKREEKAGKVNFTVLLRATYHGRRIRR